MVEFRFIASKYCVNIGNFNNQRSFRSQRKYKNKNNLFNCWCCIPSIAIATKTISMMTTIEDTALNLSFKNYFSVFFSNQSTTMLYYVSFFSLLIHKYEHITAFSIIRKKRNMIIFTNNNCWEYFSNWKYIYISHRSKVLFFSTIIDIRLSVSLSSIIVLSIEANNFYLFICNVLTIITSLLILSFDIITFHISFIFNGILTWYIYIFIITKHNTILGKWSYIYISFF